ncbi:MAG TPA: hypothetical protein DCF92_03575 [Idiomarina sp.]|nr:hypothetical protein [Idiomarina sp.]
MLAQPIKTLRTHENEIVRRINLLVLAAFSLLLWVDTVTGAAQWLGLPLTVFSVLFKMPLIALMLLMLGAFRPSILIGFLAVIVILMIGPTLQFLERPKPSFLFNDISLTLKILTPLITFFYCRLMIKLYSDVAGRLIIRALWINLAAIIFNLSAGVAGLGYPSYAPAGGGQAIGINGFYVAGNELGACFVLLYGFALHYSWNRTFKMYLIMALAAVVSGLLIATKTAMLSSFLLIFAIPLFNERENLTKLTSLKIKVFIPMLVALIAVVVFISQLLQAVGLYEKFVWIVQEKGVLTLILSGRDEFARLVLDGFQLMASTFNYFFGIGTSGISEIYSVKYKAEIDPIDIFVVFGMVGLIVCAVSLVAMNIEAFRKIRTPHFFAPAIVAVNLVFVVLIFVSGHILYSGMLGMLWGMLNSLAFIHRTQEDINHA